VVKRGSGDQLSDQDGDKNNVNAMHLPELMMKL